MAGFFFRHVCLVRRQNMGRRLRAMRVILARKRRETTRMLQSQTAMRIAAEQIERDDALRFAAEQIGRRNELMLAENALIDQLVYNLLAEIEDDPFIRNALEQIRAQNPAGRNIFLNQAQPPRGGRWRRRP